MRATYLGGTTGGGFQRVLASGTSSGNLGLDSLVACTLAGGITWLDRLYRDTKGMNNRHLMVFPNVPRLAQAHRGLLPAPVGQDVDESRFALVWGARHLREQHPGNGIVASTSSPVFGTLDSIHAAMNTVRASAVEGGGGTVISFHPTADAAAVLSQFSEDVEFRDILVEMEGKSGDHDALDATVARISDSAHSAAVSIALLEKFGGEPLSFRPPLRPMRAFSSTPSAFRQSRDPESGPSPQTTPHSPARAVPSAARALPDSCWHEMRQERPAHPADAARLLEITEPEARAGIALALCGVLPRLMQAALITSGPGGSPGAGAAAPGAGWVDTEGMDPAMLERICDKYGTSIVEAAKGVSNLMTSNGTRNFKALKSSFAVFAFSKLGAKSKVNAPGVRAGMEIVAQFPGFQGNLTEEGKIEDLVRVTTGNEVDDGAVAEALKCLRRFAGAKGENAAAEDEHWTVNRHLEAIAGGVVLERPAAAGKPQDKDSAKPRGKGARGVKSAATVGRGKSMVTVRGAPAAPVESGAASSPTRSKRRSPRSDASSPNGERGGKRTCEGGGAPAQFPLPDPSQASFMGPGADENGAAYTGEPLENFLDSLFPSP